MDFVDYGSEEGIKEFLESQRRISKIRSVANEREVRLVDVEGKTKKSKKSSGNGADKTDDESADATTAFKPNTALAKIPEEGSPDRIGRFDVSY